MLYALLVGGWILQCVLGHILYAQFDLNINHSILGHLGVCSMGIWFARRKEVMIPWWLLLLSVVMFIGGNFFYELWIPSRVVLLLFLLPLLRGLCGYLARAAVVWCSDAAAGSALGVFVFMQRLSEAAYCRVGKTRISLVDIYMDMHCFHIDRDGMGTDDAHV